MRNPIPLLVVTAMCLSTAVVAQEAQGPATYTRQGHTIYGSDGSTAERYGNKTYSSDGKSYETYGNTTYGSDGSRAEKHGNTTFIDGPNGQTRKCEKVADQTFCDDE